MKKAAIISCFNYYSDRLEKIEDFFTNNNFSVTYITSDYEHYLKNKYNIDRPNVVQVKVPEYKKNISLKRIFSHIVFSWRVYSYLKKNEQDLIYLVIPPNFLLQLIVKLKGNKPDIKIICDIYDLWPEALIKNKLILGLPILKNWRNFREKSLKNVDAIVKISGISMDKNRKNFILYPYSVFNYILIPIKDGDVVHLCFMGGINYVMDIDLIVNFIFELDKFKKVCCHIIGEGQMRKKLITLLEEKNIAFEYYGIVMDPKIKNIIYNKCWFGINMAKKGMSSHSLKSIDYISAGLPVINANIGDTYDLIEKYNIGYNLNDKRSNISCIVKSIANLKVDEINYIKNKTKEVGQDIYSVESFYKKLKQIYREVMGV